MQTTRISGRFLLSGFRVKYPDQAFEGLQFQSVGDVFARCVRPGKAFRRPVRKVGRKCAGLVPVREIGHHEKPFRSQTTFKGKDVGIVFPERLGLPEGDISALESDEK